MGLPQLLMRSQDPMQNTTLHVQTTCAEFLSTLAWMEQHVPPLQFGSTPIYVLTAGNNRALTAGTEAERQITQANWNTLHEEWVAASTSDFRRHGVVPGADHYLHRTHPDAVLKAARELLHHIEARRAEYVIGGH
jgi:pimeloyl-ACP methyl ester carboxylesterase